VNEANLTAEQVLIAQARRFSELTHRKRELEGQLGEVKRKRREVEQNLVTGMLGADVQNMTVGGFQLYVYNRLSVRARDKDHIRLARVLFDIGREDLIVIGPQRLGAAVREEDDVEALPPELREAISIERLPRVGARKA